MQDANGQEAISPAKKIFSENSGAVIRVEIPAAPDSPSKNSVIGSGFIIGKYGIAVTAKHLLSAYKNSQETPIKVRIGSLDGKEVSAEPQMFDIGLDIAILNLRHPSSYGISEYPVLKRGDSRSSAIGDFLYVVGFRLTGPIGLSPGVLTSNHGGGPGGNTLWELSAGVTNGSSGAPVFNSAGEVIGVVTGGVPATSVNYMYPESALEPYAALAQWYRRPPAPSSLPTATHNAIQAGGSAIVFDGWTNYNRSGFSFSKAKVVAWDSPDADLLVAKADRTTDKKLSFFIPNSSDPYNGPRDQEAKGGVIAMKEDDLNKIVRCPEAGYKAHWQDAVIGATYCLRLRSGDRFAKVKVQSADENRLVFDWEPDGK
ncbi:hypothetical protein M2440_000260 [Methylorubrum extorquens]|uniref:S1 family peptidase n=1 Tax=Methylorubrum extorquens TaxID=408 RepID=UPI00209F2F6A|nr:serine protease [Methylorubrum extorquens]MCP1561081.1 hypothetical protein [Methylorubrum extorquens]MDF9789559.1 hypothetical protein [Methylorubrum extorquens]